MPCNSDYMEPNHWERQISQVACLHDELDGKEYHGAYWFGAHPRVYCKGLTKEQGDEMVADLCYRLQNVDVTDYSLELQMWWRDHQAADKRRVLKELKDKEEQRDREKLLAALTPYERKLLGY